MRSDGVLISAILAGLAGVSGAQALPVSWVTVGDAGNMPDARYESPGYGAVDNTYRIGMFEVTNAEYAEFLNAVAASDPYDLYNTAMASSPGGITREGRIGEYTYDVIPGRGQMPVNFVSFWDAARFANWLHNGQGLGDTETGAYTLTPDGIANNTIARNADALSFLPSEDEWYKAAYYQGGGTNAGYWDFPTESNAAPAAEGPPGTDALNGSANYGWSVGDVTDVGSYTFGPSTSAYGAFDLAGNLYEWNEAVVTAASRGVRGGSFFSTDALELHAVARGFADAINESSDIGFRIANVPEPAALPLLALAALTALKRRW